MHISKIVDYVKNEINFSEEFCKDNIFVTLRIEPILKIIENLEQSHKDILEYAKEIEKKDKIIDLMAEEIKIPEPTMKIESFDIKPKTKFGMRYLNKEEVKQYFERKSEE